MEDKKLNVKRIRQEIDKESNENELISRLNNSMAGIKVEPKKVFTKVNTNFDDAKDSVDEFAKKCRESVENKELIIEKLRRFGTEDDREKFKKILGCKNKQEMTNEEPEKKKADDIDIASIFGDVGDKSSLDYLVNCKGDERIDDDKKSIVNNKYEYVNHPSHYNNYSIEVIDMMLRIYGPQKTFDFCEMNAFKYRMRMGTKPGVDISQDLEKERWYLAKAKSLKAMYNLDDHGFFEK